MRRAVLLLTLMAVVVIAAGMAISASSGTAGTTSSQVVQAPLIETFKLTADASGNWRHPGVAEDSKGNRLVIFRGPSGDRYWYAYCKKGGSWSSPALIPNQPSLTNSLYADIAVDSTDRFHCLWEKTNEAPVYGSFRDGEGWSGVQKLPLTGRYDLVDAIAVRSTDEVLAVDTRVIGSSKDIWLHTKKKDQAQFSAPKNLTNDWEGSTQGWLAVDSKDHIWVVHKSDYPYNPDPTQDILVIYLSHWDQNNNPVTIDPVEIWQFVSETWGWSFLPQVAVNSEDKVMTAWAFALGANDYVSRLYNPSTKTLGPIIPVNIGLTRNPWHTFYLRLAAHGKDFYLAVIDSARILYLYRFDEMTSKWIRVAQVSDRSVEQFDLYSGYDRMLVAWSSWEDPTDVYLTAVEVNPLIPPTKHLTIQAGSGGTTDPAPGTYTHRTGSSVTITAIPNFPFEFTSWSGDVTGSTTSITVILDADKTVKANFRYLIQPAVNVTVQKKVERGFFNAYYFNILSWESNPLNTAQGVTIAAQRIYRKLRTEANTQWTRIVEVSPTTMTYIDRNVAKYSDYVYAVACVDASGIESPFY